MLSKHNYCLYHYEKQIKNNNLFRFKRSSRIQVVQAKWQLGMTTISSKTKKTSNTRQVSEGIITNRLNKVVNSLMKMKIILESNKEKIEMNKSAAKNITIMTKTTLNEKNNRIYWLKNSSNKHSMLKNYKSKLHLRKDLPRGRFNR